MSTKTTIKRIALVAAVAAALGGLSTVAANAGTEVSTSITSITLAQVTGSPTVGAPVYVNVGAQFPALGGNTAHINAYLSAYPTNGYVQTSDTTTVQSGVAGTTATNQTPSGVSISNSGGAELKLVGSSGAADTSTASSTAGLAAFVFTPTVAGSYTLTAYADQNAVDPTPASYASALNEAISSLTITVGAAPLFNAAASSATLSATAGTPVLQGGSDAVLSATKSSPSSATPTAKGTIAVYVENSTPALWSLSTSGVALSVSTTGSAAVAPAGAGSYSASTWSNAGAVASLSATAMTGNSVGYFDVYSNGTAGTGTITISGTDPVSGVSTVIATKTVTFTGSPASVSAVQLLSILKAGGSATSATSTDYSAALTVATTPAVVAYVKDSNGNSVADSTGVKIVSSNTAVVAGGACVNVTGTGSLASTKKDYGLVGVYNCPVAGANGAASGATASLTVEAYDSTTGAYDFLATPLTFTIGGAIAKETIALDSTSYTPLAPMTITVSAFDSSGNKPYDQDVGAGLVYNPIASTQIGGYALTDVSNGLSAINTLVGGSIAYTGFYAPSVNGNFTISGGDVTTAHNAISATATVAGGGSTDAANAATDAANQATDAANNAIDAANAAADTAQTAADAAQSAADTATQALAAAQDANQNATDALAAAQEATDAGNAATDAANAAADSADAATAAAQDASDKAAAALAAVTQLSAQFTTLAAQVAKVLTAVQAIAKATTPAKKK